MRYLVNTDDPGLRDQYGRPAFQVVAGPGGKPTQLVGLGRLAQMTPEEEQATVQGLAAGVAITLGVVGAAASAYHGYKRNDSLGWAATWGVLGWFFPVPTVAYAAGQGFAKPA
jgi:hypothetical protein